MLDLPPVDKEVVTPPPSHFEQFIVKSAEENENSITEINQAQITPEVTPTSSTDETITVSDSAENTSQEADANPITKTLPSDEDLLSQAKQIKAIFEDGFQWSDLGKIVKQSYEFVSSYEDVSSEEMKTYVTSIIYHLIDITDTPYLPDRFTDPLFKAMVPPFVEMYGDIVCNKLSLLSKEENDKPTGESLIQYAEVLKNSFSDGFQWSDLAVAVKSSVEFVGSFPILSVEEKKECVTNILNHLIDITDTPKLPDTFIDPVFKSIVSSFVDAIFSKLS